MKSPFKLQIEANIEDFDGYNDIENYLNKAEALKPVKVMVTTEYAESLEYGTGPLKDFQPLVHGGSYTWDSIYRELYKWAGEKETRDGRFPIKDEGERRAFALNLTGRFWHYGMSPHPYFRPAIKWMIKNAQSYLDKGKTMKDLAEECVRIIMFNIREGDHIFNGQLLQSVGCETLSYDETKELSELDEHGWEELLRESGWYEDKSESEQK